MGNLCSPPAGGGSSWIVSRDAKIGHLKLTPFATALSDLELDRLAGELEGRTFQPGCQLFAQDESGDFMFLIVEGQVSLFMSKEGQAQKLGTKGPGQFVGESAVLDHYHERRATAVVDTLTNVLRLDRDSWEGFIKSLPSKTAGGAIAVMGEEIVKQLKGIDFLWNVSEEHLHVLGTLCHYVNFDEGQTIFEAGTLGDGMYVVVKGAVEVTGFDDKDECRVLATLHPGAYFGEIALIVDMPRTASTKALQKCSLLEVNKADFARFIKLCPEVKQRLQEKVKSRIALQFRSFKIPFFQSIAEERYEDLAATSSIVKMPRNKVVFREGDVGDAFYLILIGSVFVGKEGDDLGFLRAGKYFGEIALVAEMERTATITTREPCVFLVISKDRFKTFFEGNEASFAEFSLRLARDKVPLQSVLQHPEASGLFRIHIESEYSAENLDFFLRASAFESISSSKKEKLKTEAGKIIDTFLTPGGKQEVNLSASIRDDIKKHYDDDTVMPSLLVEARKEIVSLMSSDTLKRFKRTQPFKDLLEKVGSYDGLNLTDTQVERLDTGAPRPSVTSILAPQSMNDGLYDADDDGDTSEEDKTL